MSAAFETEAFLFLQEAFSAAAAVSAAAELGVLRRIDAGPASCEELARDCGLGARGTRLLLAALVELRLIRKDGDERFSGVMPDLEQRSRVFTQWASLPEALRTGCPQVAGNEPAGADELYPGIVGQLASLAAPLAQRAAAHLARPRLRILDVGAGAAPWSLAIVAREPSCRVTAVDVPGVLEVTRRSVACAGRAESYELLAGDIFRVDLAAAAFDLVLLANVCHLLSAERNQALITRLAPTLRAGGRMAILDQTLGTGGRVTALYALGLLLRSQAGEVYPLAAIEGWLKDAGLDPLERRPLDDRLPLQLVLARKPR